MVKLVLGVGKADGHIIAGVSNLFLTCELRFLSFFLTYIVQQLKESLWEAT